MSPVSHSGFSHCLPWRCRQCWHHRLPHLWGLTRRSWPRSECSFPDDCGQMTLSHLAYASAQQKPLHTCFFPIITNRGVNGPAHFTVTAKSAAPVTAPAGPDSAWLALAAATAKPKPLSDYLDDGGPQPQPPAPPAAAPSWAAAPSSAGAPGGNMEAHKLKLLPAGYNQQLDERNHVKFNAE